MAKLIFSRPEEEEEDIGTISVPYAKKIYENLLNDRVIFLADDITVELATNISATFLYLDKQNNNKISLYINSPGGDVDGLFSILDIINLINSPVETICFGEASSCAAILLAAGTPGLRKATENSKIMIHQMQIGSGENPASEAVLEMNRILKDGKKLIETLARYCGQRYEKVNEDCQGDNYLTPKEAKAYGIVDIILPPNKTIPKLSSSKSKSKRKRIGR
jgi:ATP-dependent Clp protease protease subunit